MKFFFQKDHEKKIKNCKFSLCCWNSRMLNKQNHVLTKNKRSKDVTQTQQQRPQSPTVTLTWHAGKHKVHKLHHRCWKFDDSLLSRQDSKFCPRAECSAHFRCFPSVSIITSDWPVQVKYFRWSLYTLYLLICQVRVTVGDSGLLCVCVTSSAR